jgi:hypothetical protein
VHLRNRPANTIKETDNRISSLYQMKFTSCNEQHDTFLLTQLKTTVLRFFPEKFCAFCNAPKEIGKYRSTWHIITACKYTEHVNVAPAMCTYILELPSSILGWGKLKARKCWESWPTSIVQQQLDPRPCTSYHIPVTLPSTSCNNMIH